VAWLSRKAKEPLFHRRLGRSCSGDPSDRSKWDFTRRGVEEYLHTRNQAGSIFDDVEKHTGESMTLRRAITTVTQSLPDGASKVVAATAISWCRLRLSHYQEVGPRTPVAR
jgi:hypothetical protein